MWPWPLTFDLWVNACQATTIEYTCIPSLVLIAQAVFLFRARTDRRDWTPYPCRRGTITNRICRCSWGWLHGCRQVHVMCPVLPHPPPVDLWPRLQLPTPPSPPCHHHPAECRRASNCPDSDSTLRQRSHLSSSVLQPHHQHIISLLLLLLLLLLFFYYFIIIIIIIIIIPHCIVHTTDHLTCSNLLTLFRVASQR